MITEFRDQWLRRFYLDDEWHKRVPNYLEDRLFRKLQLIDDATCVLDLQSPPSNHYEQLTGKLKGYCSIRINHQWRLIFKWNETDAEATDLYLDNHSYR